MALFRRKPKAENPQQKAHERMKLGDWLKLVTPKRLWKEHKRKKHVRGELRRIKREARFNAEAGGYSEITKTIDLFRKEMGVRYRVPPEGVLPGAGSTTILNDVLGFVTRKRATGLLFPKIEGEKPYTDAIVGDYPWYYAMLTKAEDRDLRVVSVPRDPTKWFAFDVRNFVENVMRERPKVVYLAVPTNPDGMKYGSEQIRELLEGVRKVSPKSIILLDVMIPDVRNPVIKEEKYVTQLMKEFPDLRLIITNSYSKSRDLIRPRVGYGLTVNEDVMTWLRTGGRATADEKARPSLLGDFHISPIGYEKVLRSDIDWRAARTRVELERTIGKWGKLCKIFGIETSESVSWFGFNKLPERMRTRDHEARRLLQEQGMNADEEGYVRPTASGIYNAIKALYGIPPFKPASKIHGFPEQYGGDVAEQYFRIILDHPQKLKILRQGLKRLFKSIEAAQKEKVEPGERELPLFRFGRKKPD